MSQFAALPAKPYNFDSLPFVKQFTICTEAITDMVARHKVRYPADTTDKQTLTQKYNDRLMSQWDVKFNMVPNRRRVSEPPPPQDDVPSVSKKREQTTPSAAKKTVKKTRTQASTSDLPHNQNVMPTPKSAASFANRTPATVRASSAATASTKQSSAVIQAVVEVSSDYDDSLPNEAVDDDNDADYFVARGNETDYDEFDDNDDDDVESDDPILVAPPTGRRESRQPANPPATFVADDVSSSSPAPPSPVTTAPGWFGNYGPSGDERETKRPREAVTRPAQRPAPLLPRPPIEDLTMDKSPPSLEDLMVVQPKLETLHQAMPKRGRPRKSEEQQSPAVKRKRGRPRKQSPMSPQSGAAPPSSEIAAPNQAVDQQTFVTNDGDDSGDWDGYVPQTAWTTPMQGPPQAITTNGWGRATDANGKQVFTFPVGNSWSAYIHAESGTPFFVHDGTGQITYSLAKHSRTLRAREPMVPDMGDSMQPSALAVDVELSRTASDGGAARQAHSQSASRRLARLRKRRAETNKQ
jgi:hypothetical protein